MKSVKSIVNIVGIVVKYSAIIIAIFKGLQVMYDELQKINTNDINNDDDSTTISK
jgi:hypothetical protein